MCGITGTAHVGCRPRRGWPGTVARGRRVGGRAPPGHLTPPFPCGEGRSSEWWFGTRRELAGVTSRCGSLAVNSGQRRGYPCTPEREAPPASQGRIAGVSELDLIRRLCRHRQSVGVVPSDASGEPCEARICDAPDRQADGVIDRNSEIRPGAAANESRPDAHGQDDGLPLIHATRRGS